METSVLTHREAMHHAERARIARLEGKEAEMAELMRRALELEREAAYGLLQEFQAEPTRSVLFRSAAALALECGETEEQGDWLFRVWQYLLRRKSPTNCTT